MSLLALLQDARAHGGGGVAYARMQRVVLHGASGAIIGWEALLRDSVPITDGRKRPVLIALLLLGLGVLVGPLA